MAPNPNYGIQPAFYNIQDPATSQFLAYDDGIVTVSPEAFKWEVSATSSVTHNYIKLPTTTKYLKDTGSSYELADSTDANSEWQGLSIAYVSPLVIVLFAGFRILIPVSCVLEPALSSTRRPVIT